MAIGIPSKLEVTNVQDLSEEKRTNLKEASLMNKKVITKRKHNISMLILSLIICMMLLTGCGDNKDDFIGTWENADGGLGVPVYEINEDGTATWYLYSFSGSVISTKEYEWEIKDDNIIVLSNSNASYELKLDTSSTPYTLSYTDGNSVFEKVE